MIMFIVTAVESVGDISGVIEGGLGREASDKELSGGADIILLPEIPYDVNKIVEVIKDRDVKGLNDTVIVVSESAKPKDGDVVIKKIVADTVRLGGIGDQLASQLEGLIGAKEVRATNIGHTQRGGETSKGGSHNVVPNGFVVKTARNIGISFGD